ncbi:MAG: DEAD/DEAH box helicase [Desulfobacterales bacterium]|nr:DEAD/DEAH box helicase [Desulfobacterales bacterium]
MTFEPFNLHTDINYSHCRAGIHLPHPHPGDRPFPPILDGRDVLGLAQTGTGKTAAFVLPHPPAACMNGRAASASGH